jgi:2',3'-cyclic-nucleotide 2'-phosphodiesterase (5'-nucleotidase family)
MKKFAHILVAVAALWWGLASAQEADIGFFNLADLHSAYGQYESIIAYVDEIVAKDFADTPVYILINGDIFELGNALATRSEGVLDWFFLEQLQATGDDVNIIINLGNHEFDFLSPQVFLAEAQARGFIVIGNIIDKMTGELLAPAVHTINVDGTTIDVVGMATNERNTYPAAVRGMLTLPDPVTWASYYDTLTILSDYSILLSHAGVTHDREILAQLPDNVLFAVGGHNHIFIEQAVPTASGETLYLHNGFKGETMSLHAYTFAAAGAEVAFTGRGAGSGSWSPFAEAFAEVAADFLAPEDAEVIGTVPRDYSVFEAAQWAVETLRQATSADVAMLNHTSFGAGLEQGALERYEYDAFLRFDNDVVVTEVDGATLRTILATANQPVGSVDALFTDVELDALTGDFVYASEIAVAAEARYRLVTSSWVAAPFNQRQYLGVEGLTFETVPDVTTKGILLAALN